MKTSLPKCPFCGYPRDFGFVCEKCGADLIWLIPWSEGGAALQLEDKPKYETKLQRKTDRSALATSPAAENGERGLEV